MRAEAATATIVSAIKPLCRWNGRTERKLLVGAAQRRRWMVVGGRRSTCDPEDLRPRDGALADERRCAAGAVDNSGGFALAATAVDDDGDGVTEESADLVSSRRRPASGRPWDGAWPRTADGWHPARTGRRRRRTRCRSGWPRPTPNGGPRRRRRGDCRSAPGHQDARPAVQVGPDLDLAEAGVARQRHRLLGLM